MPLNKLEIPVGDEQDPDNTMTDAQDQQVDLIQHAAYRAICAITGEDLPWDMEWIGEVADSLCEHAMRVTGKTEMEIYPYTEM
jgi:hypothetical protein